MQSRKFSILLSVILIFLAFQSCEKYVILPPEVDEDVTFSGTIQPIFQVNAQLVTMEPDIPLIYLKDPHSQLYNHIHLNRMDR